MVYKNLLLIDDDDEDQEIFLTALGKISESVSCTTLTNASEALVKLTSHELQPDVIFLDLNMPVMNGQQFLMEIKKIDALSHIPVIIFSTSSNAGTIRQAKELGAHDFITKPDKFDELIKILYPLVA